MKDLTYNTWLPYNGDYEKNECDIKMKDGTILKHFYPNAGMFHACCDLQGTQFEAVNSDDVTEIMYRNYYLESLCDKEGNCCNGLPRVKKSDTYIFSNPYDIHAQGLSHYYPNNGPTATHSVRTEPKIGRNEPCPCNSGKKYKKCCVNKLN